jgi:hypothetical protein
MIPRLRHAFLAAALLVSGPALAQDMPPCRQQFASSGWDIQTMIGEAGDLYALRGVGTAEAVTGGATEVAAPELGILALPADDIRHFVIRFPSFMLGDRHFSNDGADDAVDEGDVTAQLKLEGAGGSETLDPPDDSAPNPVTRWEFDWDPLGTGYLEGAAELTGELVIDGTPALAFRFDLTDLDAAMAEAVKAHDALGAQLSARQCQS